MFWLVLLTEMSYILEMSIVYYSKLWTRGKTGIFTGDTRRVICYLTPGQITGKALTQGRTGSCWGSILCSSINHFPRVIQAVFFFFFLRLVDIRQQCRRAWAMSMALFLGVWQKCWLLILTIFITFNVHVLLAFISSSSLSCALFFACSLSFLNFPCYVGLYVCTCLWSCWRCFLIIFNIKILKLKYFMILFFFL